MEHSEQLGELAAALARAQAKFSAILKTSTNPFFKSKYAGLPEVVQAASPIISEEGLSISQFLGCDEQGDTLTTYLLHSSGQFISRTMRLHLTKEDAQGQGSATTYARRYSYMAVLGLVADEDDDGNAAIKPNTAAAAPPATPLINITQAAELMGLAKALGFDTRDKAYDYLNTKTGLTDWTMLPAHRFVALKQQLQDALPVEDGDPFDEVPS